MRQDETTVAVRLQASDELKSAEEQNLGTGMKIRET